MRDARGSSRGASAIRESTVAHGAKIVWCQENRGIDVNTVAYLNACRWAWIEKVKNIAKILGFPSSGSWEFTRKYRMLFLWSRQ